MSFAIIVPHAVTAANISATNIATEPAYSGAASYAVGDEVLGADGQAYRYIGAPGTTHDSPMTADQTDWVLIGPPNRLRPFDAQLGVDQARVIETRATNPGSITYTLTGLPAVMGVAFWNMSATSFTVSAPGWVVQGEPYTITETLNDDAGVDGSFWRYLTLPLSRVRNYALADTYIPAGEDIEITISNADGTAAVGGIIFGVVQNLGVTLEGAQWEPRSRSFKSFDSYKTSLVRRFPGNALSCDMKVHESFEAAARRVIEDLDGVPAVYVPVPGRVDLLSYGVHTSARTTARANGHTFLNLRVEAI